MKAPLGTIIVNVALIHGAGLVLLSQSQHGPALGGGHPQTQVVQMRLVKTATTSATTRAPVEPAMLPYTTPLENRPAQTTNSEVPALASSSQPATQSQALSNANDDNRPSQDEYIPRPRLSISPTATTPVIVPFPTHFDTTGRFTAVLALFIDEDGIVRRVRVNDSTLPPSMESAAKQAFLQTHFRPGQVKGQLVKSLIHIEVVFDNSPIAGNTTSWAL